MNFRFQCHCFLLFTRCAAFVLPNNVGFSTTRIYYDGRKLCFGAGNCFGDNNHYCIGKKKRILLHAGLDSKQGSRSIRKQGKKTSRHHGRSVTKEVSTGNEKTVVILYFKPPNVITSHSSSDPISFQPTTTKRSVTTSSNDTTEHQKHQRNNNNNNNNFARLTVYDDVMSLKGFVGYNHLGNTADTYPTSFAEVTGIQSKLHAVGRLDADTTGLLLLTNDGGLVHHVTNPTASSNENSKVLKTYEALIMGHHTISGKDDADDCDSVLLRMKKYGVDIGTKYGGWTQPPTKLKVLSHPSNKSTLVQIAISEGKNRQIRRMFHAVQSGVIRLHRSAIGYTDFELNLDGLSEGQWRILTKKEIETSLGWNVRQIKNVVRRGNKKFSEKNKKRGKFRQHKKKQ